MTGISTRGMLVLAVLMLVAAPLASATYTITITYDLDDAGKCVESITVDPWEQPIDCRNHLKWCGGSSDGAPQLSWLVKQPLTGYKWKIEHKSTLKTERHYFPDVFELVGPNNQWTGYATLDGPSIAGQGTLPWTYTVHALPAQELGCDDAMEDPQVVFNGGSGGKFPTGWVLVAVATLLILAALAVLGWRRLTTTSGAPS